MDADDQILSLTQALPNVRAAARFYGDLRQKHLSEAKKLLRPENLGLLADALALAAWSDFLAQTLLQNKDYFDWLKRQRTDQKVRTTEDLIESLARFALTNSGLEPAVLLARFRRRELLRIYLRDIRNLGTVAETTLDLSNLADAILEYALRIARQELENRWGAPLETAPNNKIRTAEFCIVALGKLGSRELNYASDIDLLFLYSSDGATGATGNQTAVTNREFFHKLAERTQKIVGQSTVEMPAYRVDLRLRPHGRVGALAVSLQEAVKYYEKTARDWERQVLVRSRAAAGDQDLFKSFQTATLKFVFRADTTVAQALRGVRESKEKINQQHKGEASFNVKLGAGGIREIEFIAQALQLAFGAAEIWLREPHTLIALGRLAERGILTETEFAHLADGYRFLRTLEHRLQMENGLQTHTLPRDSEKLETLAARMNCDDAAQLAAQLETHTTNVSRVFKRVFEQPDSVETASSRIARLKAETPKNTADHAAQNRAIGEQINLVLQSDNQVLQKFCETSKFFSELLSLNPKLAAALPAGDNLPNAPDYQPIFNAAIKNARSFAEELTYLREHWNRFYIEIAALDAVSLIELSESSRRQTALAEASLNAALHIVENELKRRFAQLTVNSYQLSIGVLGLGKLGSRGMDYGSDLDLVLIFDDAAASPVSNLTATEFYSRAAEILIQTLSGLTRGGQLYRVDLRLRPDGKNGWLATGKNTFLNYVETRSAIWEWLAYVKLRAVVGNLELAQTAETKARQIIHRLAGETNQAILKSETRRVRDLLEQQKTKNLRRGEIDLKYQAGGLLDVYFAVRFLQLRDFIEDENDNRSTAFTLKKLFAAGSLDRESFEILSQGYDFLRRVDHASRLVAGRSTRLPSNRSSLVLTQITNYLNIYDAEHLLSDLAVHTANIRTVFERLLD